MVWKSINKKAIVILGHEKQIKGGGEGASACWRLAVSGGRAVAEGMRASAVRDGEISDGNAHNMA